MLTRRQLLKHVALVTTLKQLSSEAVLANKTRKKFHIGACDWSIGKNSSIEAFDVARQIGLDGIMVNMGSEKNNLHLRDLNVQQSFLNASNKTGVKIASLAIGELNNIPYKSDPRTEEWVWDSIDTAKNLGVKVVLLAFFNNNDLRNDGKGKKEVIRRLKGVAPKAEKMGVILGIESYLNATEHLNIIEQVGSKNVKVYMDFRNTADAGHDVLEEVKRLGKKNICELHLKENGSLLGKGTLEWSKIRDCLYDINYYGDGWMHIEGSMPAKADIVTSYQHNLQFVRQLFS